MAMAATHIYYIFCKGDRYGNGHADYAKDYGDYTKGHYHYVKGHTHYVNIITNITTRTTNIPYNCDGCHRFDNVYGNGTVDGNMVILKGVTDYNLTRTVSQSPLTYLTCKTKVS